MKIQEKSIDYLINYLKKTPNLSVTKRNQILYLIDKKELQIDKLSKRIINSNLFDLGVTEIIREGHNKKIMVDGELKYDIHPAEIMLMMFNIIPFFLI